MGGGSRIPKVQQLLLEYTGKYVDGHNISFNVAYFQETILHDWNAYSVNFSEKRHKTMFAGFFLWKDNPPAAVKYLSVAALIWLILKFHSSGIL